MVTISLTDFVDFVVKAGSPKFTKVRQIKTRGDYDPRIDFWKRLRDGIVDFHRNGGNDRSRLDRIVLDALDGKKRNRYPMAVAGYKKFLGRKATTWFNPPGRDWSNGELLIHVNPELGLAINGQRHIIKLYFKDEKLSQAKIAHVLVLMEEALGRDCQNGERLAVLDVASAKLHASSGPDPNMVHLLIGEAASFQAIWHRI